MNKKRFVVILLVIISCVLLIFAFKNKSKNTDKTASSRDTDQPTFLIDGYPIDKVPLYKLNKVSSNKIFVNTDPKNISEFDKTNFAYFNVVFYSDASQEEFLNYYKGIFESEIVDEFAKEDMVKGKIGEYMVSAAHYDSDNTGYIQVHLPNYNDEGINNYFLEFPEIMMPSSSMIEHEKSFGLLNQKGGEIEYTKYFTFVDSGDKDNDGKDDVDEFLLLEEEYVKEYKDKPEYSYDGESGIMKWKHGDFLSTVSFARDHGRIYLMLRKKI